MDALVVEASTRRDDASRHALLQALTAAEVFYFADVEAIDGGQRVRVPLLRLDDGSHAMVVYVAKTHPDLNRRFGGAPWPHALGLAQKMSGADWLIVKGSANSWFPIRRSDFEALIELSKEPVLQLDSLISTAAADDSGARVDELLNALRARELFVVVASADGGPLSFVNSSVKGVRSLLQAYTSRRRAGILYAGMTWEAVVDVIEQRPELNGVHVINDTDDWIVLDRADILADTA